MAELKQPELRGDENGNVRPADSRYLSKADAKKQAAYVEKVGEANAEALVTPADEDDTIAAVLDDAVAAVLTKPEPAK